MKKIVVLAVLMASMAMGAERYDRVDLLGEKVYFPKRNSEYIEELLNENTDDSFLELAWFYSELGYDKSGLEYIKEYKGNDRVKKAVTYHKLGAYNEEVEVIEILYDNLTEEEIRNCYEYILKISEDGKIILPEKYNSFKVYYLTYLLRNDLEFSNFFNRNTWTEEEESYIKELLAGYNLRESKWLDKVYQSIANPKERLEKAYAEIYNLEDTEGYERYFEIQKEAGIKISEKNDFELLHRYEYEGKTEEYSELYNKILKEAVDADDFDKMMSLYIVKGDYRLAYNLALEDEGMHFKFINILSKTADRNLVERAIADFEEKYPENRFGQEIKGIKINLVQDEYEKIDILKKYLEEKYSEKLLKEYLRLVNNINGQEEKNKIVEEYLFGKGMETDYLLREFINYNKDKDRFLDKLQLLSDISYYFYYSQENKKSIDKKYEKEYINYLFERGEFKEAAKYKTKLDYSQYAQLIGRGYDKLKSEANKKYPFALEWADMNDIKYFYLNEDYTYTQDIAEKIMELERRTAAEDYYLMKYYEQSGESDKAYEIGKKLGRRYLLKEEK